MGELTAVETPAATVDLDRLERNLERWQTRCDRIGLANRPHIKTHKCVEIAERQISLGAVGLTCQTLHEAETMAAAGLTDLLIPYNLMGSPKLERLTALLREATIAVSVDNAALLPGLDAAASAAGAELGVLVDCDTGLGRTGVSTPGAAAELAVLVARSEALRFDGFLTYPAPDGARGFLEAATRRAEAHGLTVRTVSVGGTPKMWDSEWLRPLATEYRVGTYAFHDRNTIGAGAASLDDAALTVLATVVSRPTTTRAVLDAGSKALSSDTSTAGGFGHIVEAPGSTITALNEEHAYVTIGAGETLDLGQQVRIVPNHACVVANLFEELVVVAAGEVVARWPVARGRLAPSGS